MEQWNAMAPPPEMDSTPESRVTTTAIIWGFATGMLALSIPLTAVTSQSFLILGVIMVGTTLATVALWASAGDRRRQQTLADDIKAMEARIRNLEEICSTSELDLLPEIEALESPQQQRL